MSLGNPYPVGTRAWRDVQNSVDTAKNDGFNDGREEGLKEGREEGLKEGKLEAIKKLIVKMNVTAEQAMSVLDISENERPEYLELLKSRKEER